MGTLKSLRARLFAVWALSLVASLAVGVLLVRLEGRSTSAQVQRAADGLADACDRIADAYAYYASGWAGPVPPDTDPGYRRDLATVVTPGGSREMEILKLSTMHDLAEAKLDLESKPKSK